jgi:2-haloacid dehalogenase
MLDRRDFFKLAGGLALAQGVPAARPTMPIKAVAFDALAIFDVRGVAAKAEELFPHRGSELMAAWRSRQFEYQWLRALSGQYANFLTCTEESLHFAARQLGLGISPDAERQLLRGWRELTPWPDVADVLRALNEAGLRLALLSNMTADVLFSGLRLAHLDDYVPTVLSSDEILTYKPAPHAYALATEALKLKRQEILFVAFAGWDVAGAKWFGYPTYWANRAQASLEELQVTSDAEGADLGPLLKLLSVKAAA